LYTAVEKAGGNLIEEAVAGRCTVSSLNFLTFCLEVQNYYYMFDVS